jgi:hypothetical protein
MPTTNPFVGTWEMEREAPSLSTTMNCETVRFVFIPNSVAVECSLNGVSGRDATTVDLYNVESVYPKTLHRGSFLRALIGLRILELHDIKDGDVARVRWYEVSSDGQLMTATSRPSTGPIIYRKQK